MSEDEEMVKIDVGLAVGLMAVKNLFGPNAKITNRSPDNAFPHGQYVKVTDSVNEFLGAVVGYDPERPSVMRVAILAEVEREKE